MADFFNRIESITKNTVEKGKNISEIYQIEKEIGPIQKKIDSLKIQIADIVIKGELCSDNPEIMEKIQQVLISEQCISYEKEKILRIKNLKNCPHCNSEIPYNARFCKECGKEISGMAEPSMTGTQIFCNNCGQPVAANAVFCGNCGKKI